MNLILILVRHRIYLVLWNILVFVVFFQFWKNATQSWTATTNFSLLPTINTIGNSFKGTQSLNGEKIVSPSNIYSMKTQELIFSNDAFLGQILNLDPEVKDFSDINQYRSLFEIELIEKPNMFSINVKGTKPDIALQRAKIISENYKQYLNNLREAYIASREIFYQTYLKQASEELVSAETALSSYQTSSDLIQNKEKAQRIISLISDLQKSQSLVFAQLNRDTIQLENLSKQLESIPSSQASSSNTNIHTSYQTTRQKLALVESELKEKQTQLTENHPLVKSLISNRAVLLRQLSTSIFQKEPKIGGATLVSQVQGRKTLIEQVILLKNRVARKQQDIQDIQSKINILHTNLRSVPKQKSYLAALERRLLISKSNFNGLISQIESSKVNAKQRYPDVQILGAPILDPTPTSNRLLILIYALLTASFGTLSLLLCLERQNPLLRSKDLEGTLFPISVRIPKLQRWSQSNNTVHHYLKGGENTFLQLAYGILIQEISNRCLIVTSAHPRAGKTTIALNLAKALDELGLNVLVLKETSSLDEDVAPHSDQSIAFNNLVANTGAYQALSLKSLSSTSSDQKIQIAHFTFSSHHDFKRIIDTILKEKIYDFVIVDSPCVQSSTATTLMSMVIPNLLMVVRPGKSLRFSVKDTLHLISQSHLNIVGLAVNDVGFWGVSDRRAWEKSLTNSPSETKSIGLVS